MRLVSGSNSPRLSYFVVVGLVAVLTAELFVLVHGLELLLLGWRVVVKY